jgi:PKHD-type hydroxylase
MTGSIKRRAGMTTLRQSPVEPQEAEAGQAHYDLASFRKDHVSDIDRTDEKPPAWYHVEPDFLTAAQCEALEGILHSNPVVTGRTGVTADSDPDPQVRNSKVMFLPHRKDEMGLWEHLQQGVAKLNRIHFRFDLDGPPQPPQLSEYRGGDEGHYDWHVDRGASGPTGMRKLTVAILLSDPSAFLGGDLHLNPAGRTIQVPRLRGAAVLFPGYVVHRVTPVFTGVRRSLVAWFAGPPLR